MESAGVELQLDRLIRARFFERAATSALQSYGPELYAREAGQLDEQQ